MKKLRAVFVISALLAASLVCALSQNIYSPNVAGFVKVPVAGGGLYNLIANPLSNTNNGITNLFPNAQDGDQIYRWDATIQDLQFTPYTYSTFFQAWDGNFVLRPGEGVFYANAGISRTNTFVGDVIQGSYTNPVPIFGFGSFNALGSSVPIGGSFTNAIFGIVPRDGDQVYLWDVANQDFYPQPIIATYSTFFHSWDNPSIIVDPGIGFFYAGAGPNQNPWVRTFTVP